MTKSEALKLIDDHKNKMINPMEMLQWTWLRVIILKIEDDEWEDLIERAIATMER
jgi:hypothetical protein